MTFIEEEKKVKFKYLSKIGPLNVRFKGHSNPFDKLYNSSSLKGNHIERNLLIYTDGVLLSSNKCY